MLKTLTDSAGFGLLAEVDWVENGGVGKIFCVAASLGCPPKKL